MAYTALPTKNPGDVLTSALWNTYLQGNADSGFMRMLADSTLGVSAASIDITSIPSTFAHLMIVAYLRGDTVATQTGCNITMNGDSTANYDRQLGAFSAAAAAAAEAFAASAMFADNIPAASAPANVFGANVIFLPNYANAANHKAGVQLVAKKIGVTTGLLTMGINAGFWRSALAIGRVTLTPAAGNLVAGSRVTIYGMPA